MDWYLGARDMTVRWMKLGALVGASGVAALVLAGAVAPVVSPQQSTTVAPSLVIDGVTVVDVEQGKLLPEQRVVVTGPRIQVMGNARTVPIPPGAQVVDARGKYLIPGLWDLHVHPFQRAPHIFYPLLLANGVTGIRDAWSSVPFDTLVQWRREILAGTRAGPPRQILSGPAIDERAECKRGLDNEPHICVASSDSADPRRLVDSLKAVGIDMVKMYGLSKHMYLALAAAAQHAGLPFGGHLGDNLTASEVSNRGASIIDHLDTSGGLDTLCYGPDASDERCRPMADLLRRNGTWFVPTLLYQAGTGLYRPASRALFKRLCQASAEFLADSVSVPPLTDSVPFQANAVPQGNWLRDAVRVPVADSFRLFSVVQRAGLPLLTGTDATTAEKLPGFSLHVELAMSVAEGLTPLTALQSATLNPAKLIHGTDSLGTVAAGKLADLVLLDADPLVDITNTTMIRAVVANGRYLDRAALDQLVAAAQKAAQGARVLEGPQPMWGCTLLARDYPPTH